ncbi:helix-turn-helix domain-containing protein [Fluviispira vulneris]|uniref:helix-turn-helix domain-containing protein n=1 Tax=Fluviispira vulneris TaxID=2763012 RepID=UPI0016478B1C|nr:helix-turn-helix transcriptional regulator [Fluviispira vulneris]
MELSEIIREIRLNAGLSKTEAAYIIRKSQSVWRDWENGKKKPRLNDLRRFCEETKQDFGIIRSKFSDIHVQNKLKKTTPSINKKETDGVFLIADKITNDILYEKSETRFYSKFCKLEHIDGEILITRWGDNSKFTKTKFDINIKLADKILLTDKAIKEQVVIFLLKCKELGLELKYGLYNF